MQDTNHWQICFWLLSNEAYTISCNDNGNYSKTLNWNSFTVSWKISVIIDNANASYSLLMCDKYFGNMNQTTNTVIIMQAIIYEAILSCASAELILIQTPPTIQLENNQQSIQCAYGTQNSILLSVHFVVKASNKNDSYITKLFETNGDCYIQSLELLNKYFDSSTITIILRLSHQHKRNHMYWLHTCLTFTAALIFVVVILWIIYRRVQYCKAFIVDKALVLIIGVGKFNDKKLNLPEVKNNIMILSKLWSDSYQYEVHICNQDTLYSMKQDILDFYTEHTKKLEDKSYNGVIVHIVSHGTDKNGFLSSDKKVVPIDFIIHEIQCNTGWSNNSSLIKLLYYHCCRGNANYSTGNKHQVIELRELSTHTTDITRCWFGNEMHEDDHLRSTDSNFMTVYATVDGRTIGDSGYFTHCIAESFKQNAKRYWLFKRSFAKLMTEIGQNVQKKTKQAEIPEIAGTVRFKRIIFEVGRGTKNNYSKK
eukprot:161829_1